MSSPGSRQSASRSPDNRTPRRSEVMSEDQSGHQSGSSPATASTSASTSRRGFLFTIGLAINAVAAALLGIPIVGYLLSSVRGVDQQAWIELGSLNDFAENQTRLATYVNP